MRRPAKFALWTGASLAGLIVAVVIAGYFVLRSDWLREKVRQRIVAEVEKASGGKAEIGSFHFDWSSGRATVRRFVLHGSEPATEAPLFQADAIEVGLKIVSLFRRKVDIASLAVEHPRANILVAPDGSTNLPSPKTPKSGKDPVQTLIDLAVGELQLRDGFIDYDSRRLPLDLSGSDLNVKLAYDARAPQYNGSVRFEAVRIQPPSMEPLEVSAGFDVTVEPNRLVVSDARVRMKSSEILVSGAVNGFKHPEGSFDVQARLAMAELVPKLRLPVDRRGTVLITGKAAFGGTAEPTFDGKVSASGLGIRKGVSIGNISLRSEFSLDRQRLDLKGLRVSALGGSFSGSGRIEAFDRFGFEGGVRNLLLQELAAVAGRRDLVWHGAVAGPVKVQGRLRVPGELIATARLDITPVPGAMPVEGLADVRYLARGERIELGHSWIRLPGSRVEADGVLGQALRVRVHSSNLDDFLPAIAMISPGAPQKLPVKLLGGAFEFSGTVSGPLKAPLVDGQVSAGELEVEGRKINHIEASLHAGAGGIQARSFTLAHGGMSVAGGLELGLTDWKPSDRSRLALSLVVENADLKELLAESGHALPIHGLAAATAQVSGSLGRPEGQASLVVKQPELYGQKLDRIRAGLRLAGNSFQILDGSVESGKASIGFSATYNHTGKDWKNGLVRFQAGSSRFSLREIKAVRDWNPEVNGTASLDAHGVVRVVNMAPELAHLNGEISLAEVTMNGWQAGNLRVTARTGGELLQVQARAELEGSQPVEMAASVRLAGDYPVDGRLSMPMLNIATADHFRKAAGAAHSLAFGGMVAGEATFSGPLRRSAGLAARLVLSSVRVAPAGQGALAKSGVPRDLSLTNNGPVEVGIDSKGAHIRRAEFTAKDTKITAAGTVGFSGAAAWNLRLEGTLNLAIARSFNANLRTEGNSTFNIAVRGPIGDPEVSGEMELSHASFNYAELPNGIAGARGTLVFDRNRATISKLTGHSGGGEVTLSGFVGFGGGAVLYRLAAKAANVRVRYPEGTSTTLSAALNLTGNSDQSLLSGTITVERAGFLPRTDVGGLLAAAAPMATPATPSEALRNMQLDIRIQTAANAEFATSYTQDVHAEADLHLRGTAAHPSLMGRLNIVQGQVLFFGTRYTINRGDVSFYNPTRIEPVLDLNLQTEVRGITVTINFSGTLQRLNMTYRSDPPLQTQEIIALLAVGRAPTAGAALAAGQTVSNTGLLNTGANTLLGQAVASPVSSRLQRFFGVSRLKIDPLLQGTSVDTTPQARLTLEQQISPNVTLTYVTNVTKSQQQLVRLQLDLNRQWSVVAIRDENGIFGIDFQYKRRF